jgi:hypothetical protein
MKNFLIASSVALITGFASSAVYAQATPSPNPNGTWGSQVTSCIATGCYPGTGPSEAGQYYSNCAANGCGYANLGQQILTLAKPGASTFGQTQQPN